MSLLKAGITNGFLLGKIEESGFMKITGSVGLSLFNSEIWSA
jgi:hypothetical protein